MFMNRWIGYTSANAALAQLDQMLLLPKVRRSNVLLVAAPGNGKTTLLDEFSRRHPPLVPPAGDPSVPVIRFDMPPDASETRFWSAVLRSMEVVFRESDNAAKKEALALDCLRALRVRVLIIDEFHNSLHGSSRETRQFLAVLKNLMNSLAIPIVAAGTKSAITALNSDPQMTSRFEAVPLPRWKLDIELLRFLKSLERLLPLAEPSGLASKEIAPLVFELSDGTIGGICDLVLKAAQRSIEKGIERIVPVTLREARRRTAEASSELSGI